MLNINTRISLSKKSKKRIKKFKKKNGALTVDSWKRISKKVKNDISKKLLYNQNLRCAYCQRYLYDEVLQIDHFAPKTLNPEFTFTTNNLFYSCGFCNSTGIKGSKPTVNVLHNNYNQTTFLIVHPYIDNVDAEILYSDPDRITYDMAGCSQKGLDTISFFEFDKLPMTMFRANKLLYERRNPLTTADEKALIRECIAYKD